MLGKVISVTNEKGGVGKTTLSAQLSMELAERKYRVCLIDNDPSADATTALLGQVVDDSIRLGNKPAATANTIRLYHPDSSFAPFNVSDSLYLMGATDALSVMKGADIEPAYDFCDAVDALRTKFDFVIIDCPPSFGLLWTAAMMASTSGGILIPMTPDQLAFKAAKKVYMRISQMNERSAQRVNVLGVIANKVVNPPPQSVKVHLEYMQSEFGDVVCKTIIHQTVKISDAIYYQEKVSVYAEPDSKAAQQLSAFTDEVLSRVGVGQ